MKSTHQVGFDILNLSIQFSSMIIMNNFFNFVKILNENSMFKIGLSIYSLKFKQNSQCILNRL